MTDSVVLLGSYPIPPADGCVYMVTCIYKAKSARNHSHARCWGFSFSLEEVTKWVLGNATDMFEQGYYNYAVIEQVPAGLLPFAKPIAWYKYAYSKDEETIVPMQARPDFVTDTDHNWFESR